MLALRAVDVLVRMGMTSCRVLRSDGVRPSCGWPNAAVRDMTRSGNGGVAACNMSLSRGIIVLTTLRVGEVLDFVK
jgi:hypothetical protein